jgi:DNA-binding protein HU-beta
MTKSELVKALAGKLKITNKLASQAVDEVFGIITETLEQGDENSKVQIIPFGSFSKRTRKAREGRDPRTGDKITIPERTVPVFTPGKALRDAVSK